ncbi:MAG: hypothetical protein C0459_03290 [Chitinophaga sp.]|mgnify:CR=1 FL=1|jgi:hypothetical protein|nr:hypothetical protein [Chitinophaga sp.]
MNIADLKHQLGIAKEQANISAKKMQMHQSNGNEYAAKVYRTRMNALNNYVTTIKKKLKEHDRKTFKKINNQ